MAISNGGLDHRFVRHRVTEDRKRARAIRLLVAASAAGILFVVISSLIGGGAP